MGDVVRSKFAAIPVKIGEGGKFFYHDYVRGMSFCETREKASDGARAMIEHGADFVAIVEIESLFIAETRSYRVVKADG